MRMAVVASPLPDSGRAPYLLCTMTAILHVFLPDYGGASLRFITVSPCQATGVDVGLVIKFSRYFLGTRNTHISTFLQVRLLGAKALDSFLFFLAFWLW